MIVCEDRALVEYIRDCCKRTGIVRVLRIAEKIQFSDNVLLSYPLAVLLLRAIMHEFARFSQAVIHGAVKSKKLSKSSISLILHSSFNPFIWPCLKTAMHWPDSIDRSQRDSTQSLRPALIQLIGQGWWRWQLGR